MSPIAYHHVKREDGSESVTVFLPGEHPQVVQDDHPHFGAILDAVEYGNPDPAELHELVDLSHAVEARFTKLSERVSVANGRVYFDGDEVDDTLTRQIVRVLDEGIEDFTPLVKFMENLAANPQDHSRSQLYEWLARRDFTITPDGCLVAYKGVESDGKGGYQSLHAGGGIVNGEPVEGKVPNPVGAVVELARTSIAFDPAVGCARGLHVGTYDYAKGYSRNGALLRVKVNPRDVVSVPTDCDAAKVRVCRYTVEAHIDAPHTQAVFYGDTDDDQGYL